MQAFPDTFISPEDLIRAEEYRRERQTAILVIAFTDIANSTALRNQLGEIEYEKLRLGHETVVDKIVTEGGAGRVVKGTGDGALIVFSEPSTAVERMCELQRAMKSDPTFNVRIGLDMGQVALQRQGMTLDVFGSHVNRASRIQSEAQPGHVLTSSIVYDSAENWLKGKPIAWKRLGDKLLKGFVREISIMEAYDPASWEPQAAFIADNSPPSSISQDLSTSTKESPRKQGQRRDSPDMYAATSGAFIQYLLATNRRLPPSLIKRLNAKFEPLLLIPDGSPHDVLVERVTQAAEHFKRRYKCLFGIAWIEDSANNNQELLSQLEGAGVAVIRIDGAALHAANAIDEHARLLIVGIGRSEDPDTGLKVLQRLKALNPSLPRIVFSPASALGTCWEQCNEAGAALVTSGRLSVLHAVEQVIKRYLRLPHDS